MDDKDAGDDEDDIHEDHDIIIPITNKVIFIILIFVLLAIILVNLIIPIILTIIW